jgi:multidrug efflux system outer membrane protein
MPPARILAGSMLVSLTMAACTLSPQRPGETRALPAAWKNAGSFPTASPSRDLSRWWDRFNDPTLSRLIRSALDANPDIASASARIRESRARRNAEAASLFPLLTGSASSNSRSTHDNLTGTRSGTSYSAGLDASWEADLFGKRRNIVEAASANVGAAEENLHSVQAALSSEIAITYSTLRATEAST